MKNNKVDFKIMFYIFVFFNVNISILIGMDVKDILASALQKGSFETLSSNIKMEITSSNSIKSFIEEYQYEVKKPDKIIINVYKPYKQTIVICKGQITIKNIDGSIVKQAVSSNNSNINSLIQNFSSIEGIKNDYNIINKNEYTENGENLIDIELVPINPGNVFKFIFSIDKDSFMIIHSKILDNNDKVITYDTNETITKINSVYLPTKFYCETYGKNTIKTTFIYSDTIVNGEIDDSEFTIK